MDTGTAVGGGRSLVEDEVFLVGALVVILIWRGPKMLPRIGEAFGRTVKDVRQNVPGAIKDDVSDTSEPGEAGDSKDRADS